MNPCSLKRLTNLEDMIKEQLDNSEPRLKDDHCGGLGGSQIKRGTVLP